MAENVAVDYNPVAQQDLWYPEPGPEMRDEPEQLERLLGERLPTTDLRTADQASQNLLRGLAEIVPDNADQRTVVSRGQETTMDMRSPIGRDGPHLLIGAVTQGCADKALGVWLIHDEGGSGPVVMLARPDFRPSRDKVYIGSGAERQAVGGVPISRYSEQPTLTGRAKELSSPALGLMPDTVSRRQSEYYVDDNGIVHIKNIGSNDIAVLRGPSRAAVVDRYPQRQPSSSGSVQRTGEGSLPARDHAAAEASMPPSNTWYAEQIDRIADPQQRENAAQWLAKKTEIEEQLADYRRRQEGYLQAAIASGSVSTEEQLIAHKAIIDRQVGRGIQGDHLYSDANEARYQGWQTYHLTVGSNGDVIIEYEKAESEFTLARKPHAPGKFVLYANPFVSR